MFDFFGIFRRKKRSKIAKSSSNPRTSGLPSAVNVSAKYKIGQVVKHRMFPFRGVIFDVDPQFANTDDWYNAIPEEVRPHKDQPYYHLFAENDQTHYVAYVSEGNLLPDDSDAPIDHPDIASVFDVSEGGHYVMRSDMAN